MTGRFVQTGWLCGVLLGGVAVGSSLAAQTATLPAGSAHYRVEQGGKQLGAAEWSLAPVAGGYGLSSQGEMKLGSFSYSFKNQATVDSALNFVSDTLTGSVNGTQAHANDVTFHAGSDPTGRSIGIQISGGGQANQTNTVDRHRNLVMVPDLDPGAYTLMAHIGFAQPATAWVLIPKETGLLVPADYRLGPDVRGTLNGSPVTVKHLVATVGVENALTLELFATGDGQLLEADLDQQNLQLVRDAFVLTERPKPAVPAEAAPPEQDGNAPQGQAPQQQQEQPPPPPPPQR